MRRSLARRSLPVGAVAEKFRVRLNALTVCQGSGMPERWFRHILLSDFSVLGNKIDAVSGAIALYIQYNLYRKNTLVQTPLDSF